MLQNIQNIYQHLGDQKSREIYANRLLFSLTGDWEYIIRIVKDTDLYHRVYEVLADDPMPKFIFSAGQWGKVMADLFQEFDFSGIIDNYAQGYYRDLPIMPLKDFLEKDLDATIYIASTTYHDEFCQMLKQAGIKNERIKDVTGMMLDVYHRQQYFDLPALQERKEAHEIFVDGGCYDGANSLMFAEWAGSAEKTVYAFEPDAENIKTCKMALEKTEKLSYKLISKGLWSCEDVLHFCASANEGSKFLESGEIQVPVTSIDQAVDGKVTFIKMDIEGAESEALKGAQNLIRRFKPKLAISVYHKGEDIWELPELILSYCPEYTFYLRHYSLSSEETVLYAVAD